MKVMHLLPALEQGGVESVVCELVRAGHGQWESVVISAGGRLVARVEAAGGRHLALDLKSKNPLTFFPRAWKLRKLLKAERPDVVCAHSRVPAWLFVWANRTLGLKWITYAHGANSVSWYSEVMTKGDFVIVPSNFLADYLKRHYRFDVGKLRVIPNAVDTTRFDPGNLDRAFIAEKRRAWGIKAGDRVTMAVGRITPVKGLDALIRGLCPGEKLVIVGGADRHHRHYLETLKSLAADRDVVFAGVQERIPECLAIADEVVSGNTTKPETFGLSVVEAYAMNRPVRLSRRFGGAAEVMDAVERAHASSLREAVIALYGPQRLAERTAAAYREVADVA